MGDPSLVKAAVSAIAKIAATLPDKGEQNLFHAVSQVYRPVARFASAANLDLIREACWKENALTIRYADKGDAVTERTILPLALMYTDSTLTILAWCCLREDFRMFRTDRMIEVRLAGTSFRPRRASMLRAYLGELNFREAQRQQAG